jgi:hypothetical protein
MLLTAGVTWNVVLAVHIVVAVASLGFVVAFPLIAIAADHRDPRGVPAVHRLRVKLSRSLVNPGLLVVLAAGIYLAADHHLWKRFYVQWGIGAVIVLGGLEGALVVRQSKQLAELSERDVTPAGSDVTWSQEYLSLRARSGQVGALMAVIVILTAVVMVVK